MSSAEPITVRAAAMTIVLLPIALIDRMVNAAVVRTRPLGSFAVGEAAVSALVRITR